MNQQERQALREKHREAEYGSCDFCSTLAYDDGISCCLPYVAVLYPCDVIKILDAWDSECGEKL